MDLDVIRFGFDLVQTIGVVAIGVVGWIVNRTKATKEAIDRIEDAANQRFVAHEKRLDRLEHATEGLPEAVRTLESTAVKIGGELGTLNERLSGFDRVVTRMEAVLDRHEDHLLNRT